MHNEKKLAEAFKVAPEIAPYMAELLADIWVLGSWPKEIIEMLRSLDLPPEKTSVLDLGCGKAAVSLPVAAELGFKVRGVDLYPPFIEEARERAKKLGVDNICQYEVGDMRDVIDEGRTYDIVIFASVGTVLGDLARTVGQLRRACRPGGYMVIDDLFLARSARLDRPGYQYYRSHDETIRQLTSHGDALMREKIIPISELKAYNLQNTELIRAKASALARQNPEMAVAFERYVHWEESECEILERETIPVVWLLRKK